LESCKSCSSCPFLFGRQVLVRRLNSNPSAPKFSGSRRSEDFWKYKLNPHAARDDCLPPAA
jgi:hypothetical protein